MSQISATRPPGAPAVVAVHARRDDALVDTATGQPLGLGDGLPGGDRPAGHDAPVHAGVGEAVAHVVGDADERDRALLADLGLDLVHGEHLVDGRRRLAHLLLALRQGLLGLEFRIAGHVSSPSVGWMTISGSWATSTGLRLEVDRAPGC